MNVRPVSMKRVAVTLLKELETFGQRHPPGTPMVMDEARAKRLAERGVVELTTAPVPVLVKAPAPTPEIKPRAVRRCCGGFTWK